MSELAIRVENIGKQYHIGGPRARYQTLRETIVQAVRTPFLRTARMIRGNAYGAADLDEIIWALKDVSFEVGAGEVVGIIGRNGAGKSTLLKILTRITEPTVGTAEVHGRVGSLLEVGTGFHPELTGRENIFLNGAVLGMHRSEIESKFDEIVAFAELEKFIDTPVKYYSSGMYLRLAFAVAAHLEAEILLIDEVLAVGDAEFQKRSLGKMGEVAKGGRTVLFVSHNMGAILSLCKRAILLNAGQIVLDAPSHETISYYLRLGEGENPHQFIREEFNPGRDLLVSAEILGEDLKPKTYFDYGEQLVLVLKTNPAISSQFSVEIRIKNSMQEYIGYLSSWIHPASQHLYTPGETIYMRFPDLKLASDTYYLDLICRIPLVVHVDNWWDTIRFVMTSSSPGNSPIPIRDTDRLGSVIFSDAIFSNSSS